jgi:putative transcriptional regulator
MRGLACRTPGSLLIGKLQSEFARMIGVTVSTLQNWEQGRREPQGPARALLVVASKAPEVVAKALASASRRA